MPSQKTAAFSTKKEVVAILQTFGNFAISPFYFFSILPLLSRSYIRNALGKLRPHIVDVVAVHAVRIIRTRFRSEFVL